MCHQWDWETFIIKWITDELLKTNPINTGAYYNFIKGCDCISWNSVNTPPHTLGCRTHSGERGFGDATTTHPTTVCQLHNDCSIIIENTLMRLVYIRTYWANLNVDSHLNTQLSWDLYRVLPLNWPTNQASPSSTEDLLSEMQLLWVALGPLSITHARTHVRYPHAHLQ